MSPQNSLVVSDVCFDTDWDELMQTFWDSWKTPLQASGELTFPFLGTNTPEEAEAFQATKTSLLHEAKASATTRWVKCVDQNTERIVGGGCWKHERGGPKQETNFTGQGFEPGNYRQELRNSFYKQLTSWRHRMMAGEHLYGQSLWALPDYRTRGVANLIVDLSVQDADRLGLEYYLEGTYMSTPIFLHYGFIVVRWTNMVFQSQETGQDWKRLVHDLQAHPVSICWRPKGGKYIEGKTILPWTGKAREAKL